MRKFIALLLAIFLVFPILFASQTVISVSSWALDRQFYIDALDQEQVYSIITSGPMIDKLITAQLNLPPEVSTEELKSIISEILTQEYLHEQISNFINAFFDYLQGKTDTFTPTLNTVPLKTALEGNKLDAFLNALVAVLPVCAPGQTPGFGGEGQTACKPDGFSDEALVSQVLAPAVPDTIAAIPDEIPLSGRLAVFQETSRWRSFIPGMAVPASIILGLIMLAFIAASFWYITALIADSSWHVRLQWLGWMLLIPAVLVLLLGFSTQSGIPAYWIRFGIERANLSTVPLGTDLSKALQIIAASALPWVMGAFRLVGGISIGIALILIFWGIATPRRKPQMINK